MHVSWSVTNECNLACGHCYRNAGTKLDDELNTKEGKKLLEEIASAGFRLMIFSGGEPLLREDIYELISHAKKIGLNPAMGTNGLFLTKETALKLKRAGMGCIAVSLHFLDPEKYDDFTGGENVLRKTLEAMENCKKVGLRFQVNTTVFDENACDIPKISDLAKEKGAVGHHVLFLVPTGRAAGIEETSKATERNERLIKNLLEKRRALDFDVKPTCAPQFMRIAKQIGVDTGKYTRGCLAGISYCGITPIGDVLPCPYLPVNAGNVRDRPFDKIWAESILFERLRTKKYGGRCGVCGYGESCGGCRARAFFYEKDIMGEEPLCSQGTLQRP